MAYKVEHNEASETLQGAIVGMLLGDGCAVRHRKGKVPTYLSIEHSTKQTTYAQYKASILGELTHVRTRIGARLDPRTGHTYESVYVKTRCHPLYTKLRDAFYPSGRKVVDPFWLSKLDERGLALWYLDDGSTSDTQCYLATCGFSWPENQVLAAKLWQGFGIHANVRRHGPKGQPILYIPAKSRTRLREILLPHATRADLLYKVPNERPRDAGDEIVCSPR